MNLSHLVPTRMQWPLKPAFFAHWYHLRMLCESKTCYAYVNLMLCESKTSQQIILSLPQQRIEFCEIKSE